MDFVAYKMSIDFNMFAFFMHDWFQGNMTHRGSFVQHVQNGIFWATILTRLANRLWAVKVSQFGSSRLAKMWVEANFGKLPKLLGLLDDRRATPFSRSFFRLRDGVSSAAILPLCPPMRSRTLKRLPIEGLIRKAEWSVVECSHWLDDDS